MTNLEYCNEILSIIGNVTEANEAIYNLAFDAYLKLGGKESQPSLATIYNELKSAIQIWDNTDSLIITKNGTYNLLGKIITVNVKGGSVPSDEIWYTSSDRNIVAPNSTYDLPTIVSNTYSGDKGIIKCNEVITFIGEHCFAENERLNTIIIPNATTIIERYAMSKCSNLRSAIVGNGVETIDINAFQQCINLETVILGSGLKNIKTFVFYKCSKLNNIMYAGTKAQWKQITFGSAWHLYTPAKVVHCSDGDVAI